ncbi:MAG: DUF1272 domain-containing protein [Chthoniobacterales bacterium]
MKAACEKCGAPTPPAEVAYICTFECTFCKPCAQTLRHICPNCGGELVPRPRSREATFGSTSLPDY